ncbi:hypothetical protein BOTBODRAFT_146746 [Botryobasidium botryosum FD-172 SS1]|uniref:HNH nuclease domain-containing protein n=1 Tax=Botryobasidium botryosum (strain FD-172 SS1) TaxID=930990 RepID=A0A067ML20_BOTB1|nr:hypothetical protein BOTBODRAFT_146746 [Botryobasidium botryosum FD-172 SS1]
MRTDQEKHEDSCDGLEEDRNVTVFSGGSGELLAGFWQHGAVTIKIFYDMLTFILIFDPYELAEVGWALFNDCGERLRQSDATPLPLGVYRINRADGTPCDVALTDEQYRKRTRSKNSSSITPRVSFKTRIRERDKRCVVSGEPVRRGRYDAFIATHIFPVAHQISWMELEFASQIQDHHPSAGENRINSIQNGMLLSSDIASLWSSYLCAIHPGTYQILYFTMTTARGVPEGGVISFNHCKPHERPLDSLLREHWRQCILTHVKGAGAKPEEFDFDFGTGDVDLEDETKWGGGTGKEMLEVELRRRLATNL